MQRYTAQIADADWRPTYDPYSRCSRLYVLRRCDRVYVGVGGEEMTDKAYRNLADAIVLQAVADWRALCRANANHREFAGLRHFFNCTWCQTLCGNVDPLYILAGLERERRLYNT